VLAALEKWSDSRALVISRDPKKAQRLAERYKGIAAAESDVERAAQQAELIVNATPVGHRDDSIPLDVALVPRTAAVMDLVYRRGETAWVRALRANGNTARDGTTMLLEQGALSFRQWFGMEPDRSAMLRSLQD
jgi:shikimate dehydrogenase